MRLTTVILIASLMQVSASTLAQRISLSKSNAPLKAILKELGTQSGYGFVYTDNLLEKVKPININVVNSPLEEVLTKIFNGTALTYSIDNKTVIIEPKAPSLLDKLSTVIQSVTKDLTVRGVVKDQDGKPLPNASIRIKGKSAVINTNAEGEFEIKDVADDAVLLISYVGFRTLELPLKDAVMPLEIKLNVATGELEEVKVTYSTGYQNIPKERATGSFVQLSNEDISRTVSTNVLDRIKNITNSLRDEGFGVSSIRGVSTILANQKPLIVVDGFPYEEGDGKSVQLTLNNLNPNDIESITILRDAAAASIWGARSANGVIVITTKRGKFNQKANLQFNSSTNIIEKPDLFKVNIMSSADAIEYERKLFDTGVFNNFDDVYPSQNFYPDVSPAIEILLAKRKGRISNDQAEIKLAQLTNHDTRSDISKYLLRTGINQQYNFNVNGGGDKMNYYGSIGYDKNLSSTIGNEANRLTISLKNTYQPIKNVELHAAIYYIQSGFKNNGISDNNRFLADGNRKAAPYTLLADENGVPLHVPGVFNLRSYYLDTLKTRGLLDWHYRPVEEIENSDNGSKAFNVRLAGGVKYTIIPGLNLELNGQYERSLTNIDNYYSTKTYLTRDLVNTFMFLNAGQPQYPVPLGGILESSHQIQSAYNLRGLINYNKNFGIHSISVIAGGDIRESQFDSTRDRKYGYDPNTLSFFSNMDYKTTYAKRPSGNFGSGTVPLGADLQGQLNRFVSYYGNIGYTIFNKYTLTASGRIDGSNSFGINANLKKKPFWSLGGMWDISKEDFFKANEISSLKLRATYGINGNVDNRATSYATILYNPGSSIYNNAQVYANRFTPPNPGLTWEKVKLINLGVDFGMFGNRMSGSLEYYWKRTNNLIGPNIIDPTSGVDSYTGNNAGLKANGLDLMVNGVILNRELKLVTSFSFSYNTDQVTDYYYNPSILASGVSYVGGNIYIVGKPTSKIYSYKWGGLDATNGNPMGMIKGKTVPFNEVLGSTSGIPNTKPEDLVYHGPTRAPFFGNIINTISYKGFSASFNIAYSLGHYFRRQSVDYNTLRNNWGAHGDYALRWQKPGDELITNVPSMPSSADNRYSFYGLSEVLVEKADIVRLQDIRLSYDFLKIKIKKLPFNNLSLFAYTNNAGILWRANKKHLDPILGSNQVPPSRSLAFGLTLNY